MLKSKKLLKLGIVIGVIVGLIFAASVAIEEYDEKFTLENVPHALMVNTIVYKNHEFWGFGPGMHETSFVLYQLPEVVAKQITTKGIQYFQQLPPNPDQQDRDWRGQYESWQQTPIRSEDWVSDIDGIRQKTGALHVTEYLCQYAGCLNIPEDKLQQVNELINKPGSFYAKGRSSMIVVSPQQQLVVYFYSHY